MSSAFERLQKLAEEKRLKEKANKPLLEIVSTGVTNEIKPPSTLSAGSAPTAASLGSTPIAVSSVSTFRINGQNFPVSPERDFTKVANSIVRQIPSGVFIGKSKQMYDYLYSVTRGAIKSTRSIRISKSRLMRGSGIKSTHTFYNNIRHLEAIGLVITTRIDGEKGGNSYEVILPEETSKDLAQLAHISQLSQPVQELPVAVSAEAELPALGLEVTNISISEILKTSFKDSTKNDDGVNTLFSGFVERFQTAAKKLTGSPLSKYESEKWERLADLLILELETASRHASNPVSSVPAFLTKVLSSKLLNQKRSERTSKSKSGSKPDTVGKYYPEVDGSDEEIKPLNDESKEAAVDSLREFKDDAEFLDGYKKWYTEEDWDWIVNQLDISR